jgi:hypothetical protein
MPPSRYGLRHGALPLFRQGNDAADRGRKNGRQSDNLVSSSLRTPRGGLLGGSTSHCDGVQRESRVPVAYSPQREVVGTRTDT